MSERSRLIESIILGLPIPPIFFVEGNNGVLELIDGLQRTSSVLQFLDHESIKEPELVLSGCDIIPSLNGKRFQDIPPAVRLKVKRSPIRATIINKSGDASIKYEMFKRLNTGGALLSAQEIRNCSSRMVDGGDVIYDAIQEMARFPAFSKAIARLPDSSKEKRADEELVLRFFAVTSYRSKYKGNIEDWLNAFMEDILFKRLDFDLTDRQAHFKKVFSLISEKLGDEAFTRFNKSGGGIGRLAPAYFEAAVCAFDTNFESIRKMKPKEVKERLKQAFSDEKFKDATGPGANSIPKLEERISVITRQLGGK